MADLTEILAEMRKNITNKQFEVPRWRAKRLLSAVENVLALCDTAFVYSEDGRPALLEADIRKALTDALGGGEW